MIQKGVQFEPFKSLDLRVVAAGDSFNDVSMLQRPMLDFFQSSQKLSSTNTRIMNWQITMKI